MLRKFLPVVAPSTRQAASTALFRNNTLSLLFAPSLTLLAPKKTTTKDNSKVGFEEKDVPAENLKNPVWDADEDELSAGELGEDECMLMSEDEWAFFESLQLLSEDELDLLEKDTKAAKKGGKKDK